MGRSMTRLKEAPERRGMGGWKAFRGSEPKTKHGGRSRPASIILAWHEIASRWRDLTTSTCFDDKFSRPTMELSNLVIVVGSCSGGSSVLPVGVPFRVPNPAGSEKSSAGFCNPRRRKSQMGERHLALANC